MMNTFNVTYKSMETNNNGSILIDAIDRSDAICQIVRKFPQLIVYSADVVETNKPE